MRTRMTCGSAPGTGISRAHRSGTDERPISRAATAGNWASRSGVSVKMQLTRSSAPRALRESSVRISSSVADRIASAGFSVTVLAPRSATSRMSPDSTKFAELLDLRRGQRAMAAELQRAQTQRPEGHALERTDGMADGLEHALDLALAAFADRQLDVVGADPPHQCRCGDAVLELDAVAQGAHRRLVDRRVRDPRAVGARDLELRVRELVREVAVVGQQDQAGRVVVEPSDRVQALFTGHERDDRAPVLRVLDGRDDVRRLVDEVD